MLFALKMLIHVIDGWQYYSFSFLFQAWPKQTIATAKTELYHSKLTAKHVGNTACTAQNGCGFAMRQICRICAFHYYIHFHPAVLKLAHIIPMAGHLGSKNTAGRILGRSYWPGVHWDVQDHYRACCQCQELSAGNIKKAPLVPLPTMDKPFRRIARDIVRPLPCSSSGKRYVLVMCDY